MASEPSQGPPEIYAGSSASCSSRARALVDPITNSLTSDPNQARSPPSLGLPCGYPWGPYLCMKIQENQRDSTRGDTLPTCMLSQRAGPWGKVTQHEVVMLQVGRLVVNPPTWLPATYLVPEPTYSSFMEKTAPRTCFVVQKYLRHSLTSTLAV